MKKLIITKLLVLNIIFVFAQAPSGYYYSANGKNKAELKTALYNIIKGHTVRSYNNLWTDFQTTDKRADGKVWDMYSNCTFTFITDQCGNYSNVCDCYNREHSFPKSWFNDATPMYSDLFHLYPTDGYTNGRRSNFPFGEVGNITWSGNNGSKLGTAKSDLGYSGTVFEPADEYKGDFARTYFYMVTRYENVVASWYSNTEAKPTINGTTYPAFTLWTQQLLLIWSRQDPVSQKEIDRNNAVYGIQNNRNPFIDHPELAEYIWGDSIAFVWNNGGTTDIDEIELLKPKIYPNPVTSELRVNSEDLRINSVEILDITGKKILGTYSLLDTHYLILDTNSLPQGIYFVKILTDKGLFVEKIIKN